MSTQDIVVRLKEWRQWGYENPDLLEEAIAEIERLREQGAADSVINTSDKQSKAIEYREATVSDITSAQRVREEAEKYLDMSGALPPGVEHLMVRWVVCLAMLVEAQEKRIAELERPF